MDINILKDLISQKNTIREIGKYYNKSDASVKYWLKKYGLRTLNNTGQRAVTPLCSKCGELRPKKFYGNDKSLCKICNNKRVIDKGHENRKYIIEKLGGGCKRCGYNIHSCALDMHHLDPKIKDKNFKSIRGWNRERVDKEIEKCILLCRNCHAEYHAGLFEL